MPLSANGLYYECSGDEKAYEAETTYYLNFQIVSALVSLAHLDSMPNESLWENRCQYYHFYTDHLLYSIGQIANRFIILGGDKKITKDRKKQNRGNYRFTSKEYPLLSDKRARNMVEHIDEYNQDIIQQHHGVGGFNMIDNQTEQDLANSLRACKDSHPYTLDLLRKEILIRYKDKDLVVGLEPLKAELLSLQQKVKSFQQILSAVTLL